MALPRPTSMKNLLPALHQLISAIETTEPWRVVGTTGIVGFSGNWGNFDGGTTNRPAAFMKDALGWVHLAGLVSNPTTGALGQTIFVLPAGYRPQSFPNGSGWAFATESWNSGTSWTAGGVEVNSNGNVTVVSGPVGANSLTNLNGVHFRAVN